MAMQSSVRLASIPPRKFLRQFPRLRILRYIFSEKPNEAANGIARSHSASGYGACRGCRRIRSKQATAKKKPMHRQG